MLYIFDCVDELDDGFIERSMPYLSAERREKVYSYRFLPDRKLSSAAYLLLRLALKELCGIDEPVVFGYGNNGKPFLRDYPHVHFNISHCKRAVACAISDAEVGVDVQEITPITDQLAARVLTAGEYDAYKLSPCPEYLFCEFWVTKESSLKKTGLGITADLTMLPFDYTTPSTIIKGKDYFVCVSSASAMLRSVSMRDFIGLSTDGGYGKTHVVS